jgi:hypothetical protein
VSGGSVAEGPGEKIRMAGDLKRGIAWILGHPWRSSITTILGAAIVGAITDAIKQGTESYALQAGRVILFGWHPFPVAGWLVLAPLACQGLLRTWERSRRPAPALVVAPEPMPEDAQNLRFRVKWDGRKVVDLDAICPSPKCGEDLRVIEGGRDQALPTDAVFVCPRHGCGFRRAFQKSRAVVLADARRDLEDMANGRTPDPSRGPGKRAYLI